MGGPSPLVMVCFPHRPVFWCCCIGERLACGEAGLYPLLMLPLHPGLAGKAARGFGTAVCLCCRLVMCGLWSEIVLPSRPLQHHRSQCSSRGGGASVPGHCKSPHLTYQLVLWHLAAVNWRNAVQVLDVLLLSESKDRRGVERLETSAYLRSLGAGDCPPWPFPGRGTVHSPWMPSAINHCANCASVTATLAVQHQHPANAGSLQPAAALPCVHQSSLCLPSNNGWISEPITAQCQR